MTVLARSCYEFSDSTTPGEYVHLYEALPTDLTQLCRVVQAQFIHPDNLKPFRALLPASRSNEDGRFATVERMLAGLLERNPAGLIVERTPDQRLIVSSRHQALLLASILKWQGAPTRVRVGFAGYVSAQPRKPVDHWICEVRNASEERWMFVDPCLQKVDFPRAEFELAGDVWARVRAHELDAMNYGTYPRWGIATVRDNLCHDFESVLNHEPSYREGPQLFHAPLNSLAPAQLVLLDLMAQWLRNPDANYEPLLLLRSEHPDLQR